MTRRSISAVRPDHEQHRTREPGSTVPIVERMLRVPLFYKITVANGLVVGVAALATTLLLLTLVGVSWTAPLFGIVTLGVALVVLVSVGVNALLIRLALRPLERLEKTAKRVEGGALGCRVSHSPLADRSLQRLVDLFNRMLDSLEAAHRERRNLAHTLLEAEERARSQVARELYDDLAQRLASLLLLLPEAGRASRGAPDVKRLRGELALALETVRKTARRLRPPELDELGLVPAIEAEARILSERTDRPIRVAVCDRGIELRAQEGLVTFRILQEALSNAVRHAGASRIELRIRRSNRHLVAEVEDDGRGFEPERSLGAEEAGPGLRGMRERASYIGGIVEVESLAGGGTTVRARIPLDGVESEG